MDASRSLWLLLPRRVRELPADLAAMGVMVVLTNLAVFAPVIRETPLRVPLGLFLVLFVPGYVFIAALFPEQGDGPETDQEAESSRSGIDGIERVALSFGLSIALVPLIGLVLNFTPWGIRLTPIMVAVSGFTLGAIAVAAYRRWQLPEEERFRVPYRQWIGASREELFEPESRADAALNVLLVMSILLATGSVAYAVAVPQQGEQFSELYLLTETEDGELVADGYPTEFVQTEGQEIVLGVNNNEHRTTNYTVVVVEQDVQRDGNTSVVREQRERQRFQTRLAHNETWRHSHEIAPTLIGNDTRVMWLLYVDGEPPATPTADTADYSVHLWVTVQESS
jgi:uncharacterized membrane protein